MKKGFTLIELLVTFFVIGLIAAIMVPNLAKVREESLRQTVRQQAKGLERALAEWYSAEPSVAQAARDWGAGADSLGNLGQADANYFIKTVLKDYLGTSSTQNIKFGEQTTSSVGTPSFSIGSGGGIYTNEMAQLTSATGDFIGADSSYDSSLKNAHVRLRWDPNNRATTSPKVILYLPHAK